MTDKRDYGHLKLTANPEGLYRALMDLRDANNPDKATLYHEIFDMLPKTLSANELVELFDYVMGDESPIMKELKLSEKEYNSLIKFQKNEQAAVEKKHSDLITSLEERLDEEVGEANQLAEERIAEYRQEVLSALEKTCTPAAYEEIVQSLPMLQQHVQTQ